MPRQCRLQVLDVGSAGQDLPPQDVGRRPQADLPGAAYQWPQELWRSPAARCRPPPLPQPHPSAKRVVPRVRHRRRMRCSGECTCAGETRHRVTHGACGPGVALSLWHKRKQKGCTFVLRCDRASHTSDRKQTKLRSPSSSIFDQKSHGPPYPGPDEAPLPVSLVGGWWFWVGWLFLKRDFLPNGSRVGQQTNPPPNGVGGLPP